MKRMRRKRYGPEIRSQVWLLALLGALLALSVQSALTYCLAASTSQADAPTLRVSAGNGLLSIEAQAAAWGQLLDEVSRETGIRFRLFSPLPGSVSITFHDLPATQAMQRLFGPEGNYALRFREGDARSASRAFPAEVWVLGYGPEKTSEAVDAQGESPPPVATDQSSISQEVEKEFARNPQAAREAALGATDPEVRSRAILHFGWQGNQEALHVLAQVAQDSDPEVRGKAVDALELFVDQPGMRRSTLEVLGRLVDQHPRVREVLTHVMKTAEQADIRQLAADSLGVPLDDTSTQAVSPGTARDTAR